MELEHDMQGVPQTAKLLIDDSAKNNNISIISSGYHTVLLKQDGSVWTCGRTTFVNVVNKIWILIFYILLKLKS